jgi:hypothetical protein
VQNISNNSVSWENDVSGFKCNKVNIKASKMKRQGMSKTRISDLGIQCQSFWPDSRFTLFDDRLWQIVSSEVYQTAIFSPMLSNALFSRRDGRSAGWLDWIDSWDEQTTRPETDWSKLKFALAWSSSNWFYCWSFRASVIQPASNVDSYPSRSFIGSHKSLLSTPEPSHWDFF